VSRTRSLQDRRGEGHTPNGVWTRVRRRDTVVCGDATTLCLGATVATCLLAPSPAAADTFLPTRHDDPTPGKCKPDDCSLREAILAANHHSGPDAVDLVGGQERYELTLPGVAEQEGLTGDLDVTGRLTLEVPKPGRATIDANGIDRVIDVSKATTISRLVLTGGDVGKEPQGNGGGIEANAPTRVVSSTITQNVGAGADLDGGGTVLRSTVSDNLGGGIMALNGPLVLRSSTVEGNRGGVPGSPSGAGVFATQATIDRSEVIGNVAQGACGGALIEGALIEGDGLTVTDSVFDDNIAEAGNGGALCVNGGADARVEITGSSFDRNAAFDGGALNLGGVDGSLSGLTLSGNHADRNGGGLSLIASSVTLTGSTVDNNGAGGFGGGVALDGAMLDLVTRP
jgi:CSLREA domain-containing protein